MWDNKGTDNRINGLVACKQWMVQMLSGHALHLMSVVCPIFSLSCLLTLLQGEGCPLFLPMYAPGSDHGLEGLCAHLPAA